MAASAVGGPTASNVEGYRDYRGVPVIGAWTVAAGVRVWRGHGDRRGRGLSAALHPAARLLEPVRPAGPRRWRSCCSAIGMARAAAGSAEGGAWQPGNWASTRSRTSWAKGAWASSIAARHAMLRRPTAIKLLRSRQDDRRCRSPASSARCSSPASSITPTRSRSTTTAARPKGVFYYAMEYLDGIDLEALVDSYGPQPDGRVIHILHADLRLAGRGARAWA